MSDSAFAGMVVTAKDPRGLNTTQFEDVTLVENPQQY